MGTSCWIGTSTTTHWEDSRAAYVFFEKLRTLEGQKKSAARLKNEREHPTGVIFLCCWCVMCCFILWNVLHVSKYILMFVWYAVFSREGEKVKVGICKPCVPQVVECQYFLVFVLCQRSRAYWSLVFIAVQLPPRVCPNWFVLCSVWCGVRY